MYLQAGECELGEGPTDGHPIDTHRLSDDLTVLAGRSFLTRCVSDFEDQMAATPSPVLRQSPAPWKKRCSPNWRRARRQEFGLPGRGFGGHRRRSFQAESTIRADTRWVTESSNRSVHMLATARDTDTLASIGGDEVVIVLPELRRGRGRSRSGRTSACDRDGKFTFGSSGERRSGLTLWGVAMGADAAAYGNRTQMMARKRSRCYRAEEGWP